MELESLKAAWKQQTQLPADPTQAGQRISAALADMENHLKQTRDNNRFWFRIILVGISICLLGFTWFRIQYTPEKFPHLSIALYDGGFVVGMVFLSLKLSLSYWYTRRHYRLQTKLYSAPLKEALLGMQKNFAFIYRLSIILCLVLLPPLFFLEITLFSPVFGWELQVKQILVLTGLLTLASITVGHALYRYYFNQELRSLNQMLSHLE